MQVHIPPFIYFAIAATFLTFGPLRAYYFGLRHRQNRQDESVVERKARRRHIVWGMVWALCGLYIAYMGLQLQRAQSGEGAAEEIIQPGIRVLPLPKSQPATMGNADDPAAAQDTAKGGASKNEGAPVAPTRKTE